MCACVCQGVCICAHAHTSTHTQGRILYDSNPFQYTVAFFIIFGFILDIVEAQARACVPCDALDCRVMLLTIDAVDTQARACVSCDALDYSCS